MPDISGATNFFSRAFENTVPMTLGGSILAGATTVPVSGMTNYNDADVVCFVVDATTPALKQVFTGIKSGSNVTNVVWTEFPTGGVNVPHAGGATVIDYVTSTDWDLLTTGLGKQHTQGGGHKETLVTSLTEDTTPASGDSLLTYDLSATALKKVTVSNLFAHAPSATTPTSTLSNPYKFAATSVGIAAMTSVTWTTITGYTEQFDTNSNFNNTTGTYTVPVSGFYQINASSGTSNASGNLFGGGIRIYKNNTTTVLGGNIRVDNNWSEDVEEFAISGLVQLTAGDTLVMQGYLGILGGSVAMANSGFDAYLVCTA